MYVDMFKFRDLPTFNDSQTGWILSLSLGGE